jgi:hypothetical protein
MDEIPNYYAVIPATVRYDKELKPNEKLLYGEITALANKTGECWATNKYFSDLYGVKTNAVITWIRNLREKGYIAVDYEYQNKEIIKRIITICPIEKNRPSYLFEYEGGIQKDTHNNTSNNNTSNKEEIYKEERFKAPTLDEVKDYISENNLNVDGETFYSYFTEGNWKDSRGNKVKNWKQKLRTWSSYGKTGAAPKEVPKWFGADNQLKETTQEDIDEMEALLNEL